MAELLVGDTGDVFPLTIDYSQSLAEVIGAGRYDYVNTNITAENFPVVEGASEVGAVLVRLDRVVTTEEVLRELEWRNLRPATMFELAIFGKQYPDQQRQYPIVALGSVWTGRSGYRLVGCLWEGPGRRSLDLYRCDDQWYGHCRFLAARK